MFVKNFKIDHKMFENINTEEKSYILGLIYSNGIIKKNEIIISINKKDSYILLNIKEYISNDFISNEVNINDMNINDININNCEFVTLSILSTQISSDVYKYLKISSNKDNIKFPDLEDKFKWSFIRGFFDGNGIIKKHNIGSVTPYGYIMSESVDIINSIYNYCLNNNVKGKINNSKLEFSGCTMLDFLSKIYDNSNPLFRVKKKYNIYIEWANTEYISHINNTDKKLINCRIYKTFPEAITPKKIRASDLGYDLTIIKKIKDYSDTIAMYDTGIKIQPEYGFYTEILPRSSLSKTGYMLANSCGIIDPNYLGSLKIVLTKIDKTMPDIKLPFCGFQILLRKAIHFEMIDSTIEQLEDTDRGEGGFGSTNK